MYQVATSNSMTIVMMTTLLGFLVLSSLLATSMAAPMVAIEEQDNSNVGGLRYKRSLVEIENPKEVLRVLDILAQAILDSSSQGIMYEKRGIDLGMNRGFSGRQAARHLVGLASAQFAGGPGKK